MVAYDRGGLGWSDPGPSPRDAGRSAQELHVALERAGIVGPYVLAGHSYGGLAVRAFAALYPQDVAGMVLVDGSHPDQWIRFGVASKVLGYGNKVSASWPGSACSAFSTRSTSCSPTGCHLVRTTSSWRSAGPRVRGTAGDAALAWDSRTRPMVNDAGNLGDLPLIVLSVTEQPRMADKLTAMQAELPGLSSQSRHITVEGAYHEGLLAQPDSAQVVTQAILRVVDAIRSGRPMAR